MRIQNFMDSSGIGLIVGRYRALGMGQKCIAAVNVDRYMDKLLHLSGVHRYMEIQKKSKREDIMERTNEITLIFDSLPVNEALARIAAASFCTQLNPTLEEVADLKTAVSEAVTNSIIHGYEGEVHKIEMKLLLTGKRNLCRDHGPWKGD